MKRIFVSCPMNGRSTEAIMNDMVNACEAAKAYLREDVVIVPSFVSGLSVSKPLWYLGHAIQLMADVDLAVFCPGWDKARGCQIEHNCALWYDVPVLVIPEGDGNA